MLLSQAVEVTWGFKNHSPYCNSGLGFSHNIDFEILDDMNGEDRCLPLSKSHPLCRRGEPSAAWDDPKDEGTLLCFLCVPKSCLHFTGSPRPRSSVMGEVFLQAGAPLQGQGPPFSCLHRVGAQKGVQTLWAQPRPVSCLLQ